MNSLKGKLVFFVAFCVAATCLLVYLFHIDKFSGTLLRSQDIQSAARQAPARLPSAIQKNGDSKTVTSSQTAIDKSSKVILEAELEKSKLQAEFLLYEWEALNTKVLSHLNASVNDAGKTCSFLLPRLEISKLEEIAKQSTIGHSNLQQIVLEHLKQSAGRPIDRFMYLNVISGDTPAEDELFYMDLKDENSFHIDPVTGKTHVAGTSGSKITLGDREKKRYQRIFQLN